MAAAGGSQGGPPAQNKPARAHSSGGRKLSSAAAELGGGAPPQHLPHYAGAALARAPSAPLSHSRARLSALITAVLAAATLHGFLKAYHFRQEGFAFASFLRLTSEVFCSLTAAAMLTRQRRREVAASSADDPAGKILLTRPLLAQGRRGRFASAAEMHATLVHYAAVGVLLCLANVLLGAAAGHANEPAKAMARSARLLPTLLLGALLDLGDYRWVDFVNAGVFVAGLMVFVCAGSAEAPVVETWAGAGLLGGMLLAGSLVPVLQDRLLRQLGRPLQEVLLGPAATAAAIDAVRLAASGELRAGLRWLGGRPSPAAAWALLLLQAAVAYIGICLYLKLIKHAGSKVAVIVGSCQPVVLAAVSAILLSQPLRAGHAWGLLLLGAGLAMNGWCGCGPRPLGSRGRLGSGRIIDIGTIVVPGLQLNFGRVAGTLTSHLQLPMVRRSPERRR